jgi:type II secretory pathway pseudopilin PulG
MIRTSRAREGTTLLEMMVAIGIMALMLAVAVPSLAAIWDLEQRGLARDLAQTYRFLQSEATLRNVCFRIAYDLDAGGYTIQVGDPSTLVFGTPEEREAARAEEEKGIKMFDKPAAAAEPSADGTTVSGDAGTGTDRKFTGLDVQGFESKVEFPVTTRYGFVYTPEYAEPQVPTPPDVERKEEDGPNVVYSYVFPNGDIEYTVVRIVDVDDPEDGYTVEAEPTSGRVTIDPDLVDVGASLAWLPSDPPETR